MVVTSEALSIQSILHFIKKVNFYDQRIITKREIVHKLYFFS